MSILRAWLFRFLLIVAAILMVVSWLSDWWTCDIVAESMALSDAIVLHPWGLENNLGTWAIYTVGADMPGWFAPLMWAYLVMCIVLILFSLFVKEIPLSLGRFKLSLPKAIIGFVGLSFIVFVVVFVIYASIRVGDFYGTRLIGKSHFITEIEYAEGDVYGRLLFGYWLACVVGPLFVVLAWLRDAIIGKPKLNT